MMMPVRVHVAFDLRFSMQIRHVVIVVFMRGVKQHREIARVESRLLHARDARLKPRKRQACQRRREHFLARTQIEQRTHRHVAADARCAFQIQRLAHE